MIASVSHCGYDSLARDPSAYGMVDVLGATLLWARTYLRSNDGL
jgi:hypothetical protein